MVTLPKRAESIAMIIRKAVKKPRVSMFEWNGNNWRTKKNECCPMGMHPRAKSRCPGGTYSFPPSKNKDAIFSFWMWWDFMPKKHLKEAIDCVWGNKK